MLAAALTLSSWRCLFPECMPAVAPRKTMRFRDLDGSGTDTTRTFAHVRKQGEGERHGDRVLTRKRRAAPESDGRCREACRGDRLPERVAFGPLSSVDRSPGPEPLRLVGD